MSNATNKTRRAMNDGKTCRRAWTVAEVSEIDEALQTLKAKNVEAYTDGPWVVAETLEEVEGSVKVLVGYRAEYDVDENTLLAEIDGRTVRIAPTSERAYGGDYYGNVIFAFEV